jgi:hypothetical protein
MTDTGTSDSQPARDERRWTIYPNPAGAGPEVYDGLPNDGDTEGIAAMPVEEAEAALAAARQVDEAMCKRAWNAYCETRDVAPIPAMRAALLAALNPREQA